jgi:hypothetical protein
MIAGWEEEAKDVFQEIVQPGPETKLELEYRLELLKEQGYVDR